MSLGRRRLSNLRMLAWRLHRGARPDVLEGLVEPGRVFDRPGHDERCRKATGR